MRIVVLLLSLVLCLSFARVPPANAGIVFKYVHKEFIWLVDLPFDVCLKSLGIDYPLRYSALIHLFSIRYRLNAEIQGLKKCTKELLFVLPTMPSRLANNAGVPYFLIENAEFAKGKSYPAHLDEFYFRQLQLTQKLSDWIQRPECEIWNICHRESNTDMTKYVLYLIGRAFTVAGNGYLHNTVSKSDNLPDIHNLVLQKLSLDMAPVQTLFHDLFKDVQTIYMGSSLKLVYDMSVEKPQRADRAKKLANLGSQLQQQWMLAEYWRLAAPVQRDQVIQTVDWNLFHDFV